jgi:hypothetical protein
MKVMSTRFSPESNYTYADADGKVVLFYQDSGKFKYRYSTLGFQDAAHLDDGDLWPAEAFFFGAASDAAGPGGLGERGLGPRTRSRPTAAQPAQSRNRVPCSPFGGRRPTA